MHPNARSIDQLYRALAAGDGDAMAARYHPDATFTDPVFELRGAEVGDMWRMFCASETGLSVEWSAVTADDHTGTAHWEPTYTFPATGRKVHNLIDAEFEFEDGLITRHRDGFDLGSWARQALGTPGLLLGWTPWLQNRIRRQAASQLRRFRRSTR